MNARSIPRLLYVLTLGLSAVTLCRSAEAQPSFTDKTFANADWNLKVIVDTTAGGTATATAMRDPDRGNPPPSRTTVHSYNPGLIRVAHLRNSSVYDPAVSGAIGTLSYSYDLRYYGPSPGGNFGVAYALLLRQNGTYFIGPQDLIKNDAWESRARQNLTAADFQRVDTADGSLKPDHPDFSCAGARIELGYQTANSKAAGTPGQDMTNSGIDNWSVSIVNPQPCCLNTTNESVLCATDGSGDYIYSFQVTNRSTTPAYHLLLIDLPPPATATPNDVTFAPEGGFLAPGKTSQVKTVRIHGAHAGTFTFRFGLFDQNATQCCAAVPHSLVLPACNCAQVLSDDIVCAFSGGFNYTFNIQNLTTSPPISYALVTATTPGLVITQSGAALASPLGYGGATTQTVNFSGPAATKRATVCFKLSVHDASLVRCCSIDRCVTLPSFCDLPSGASSDLNISLSTGLSAVAPRTASPGAPQQGNADSNWMVTAPRPVRAAQLVLTPNSEWPETIPGTAWISRDSSAASAASVSAIRYRRCFCIGAGAREATLDASLWADDWASLLLNGVPIAGSGGYYASAKPLSVHLTGTVGNGGPFTVGVNCLVAVVHESGNTTGLDLLGSVQAAGGACMQQP